MDQAIRLHDELMALPNQSSDQEEIQQEKYLYYVTLLAMLTAEVDRHRSSRQSDTASNTSRRSRKFQQAVWQIGCPGVAVPEWGTGWRFFNIERRSICWSTGRTITSATACGSSRRCRFGKLNSAFGDLGKAYQWAAILNYSTSNQWKASDTWIDVYHTGHEAPQERRREYDHTDQAWRSLPPNQSLDWFGWVDQFHSIIHHSWKDPREKLWLLKQALVGESRYLVSGLGGGEAAHKKVLYRLKECFGKRGVIWLTLRNTERVEGSLERPDWLTYVCQTCLDPPVWAEPSGRGRSNGHRLQYLYWTKAGGSTKLEWGAEETGSNLHTQRFRFLGLYFLEVQLNELTGVRSEFLCRTLRRTKTEAVVTLYICRVTLARVVTMG